MSSAVGKWAEIALNTGYLIVLWIMIAGMFRRIGNLRPKDAAVANSLMIAFVLLALGETGYGAFAAMRAAGSFPWLGLGILSTEMAVTFFYVVMLDAWRKRFDKSYEAFEYTLIVAAIARLIMFIHPDNPWFGAISPFQWSVLRSLPLLLQGVGTSYVILRDGIKYKDGLFKLIGMMLLLSLALYIPIVLLVQKLYWIQLLTISKTVTYIALVTVVYEKLFAAREYLLYKTEMNKGI